MASRGNNLAYMPNTSDVDPEMLLYCPYDVSHRIFAKRFPYHVMKCRKNHLGVNMSICPFNARHIIPISELRHHVANCPDRCTIEQDIAHAQAQDGSYMKGDTSVPSYHHDFHPECTENWDIEVNASSSTHRLYAEQDRPDIIHSMVGMTKAQRKEFSRRLLEVSKNNSEMTDESNEEVSVPEVQPIEGIRRPKQLPKAASLLDQRAHAAQYVGTGTHHGPHGLGRSILVANHTPMPRPGTTVQGRAIAANIFNSKVPQKDTVPETPETVTRRAPTVSMASTGSNPSLPVTNAATSPKYNDKEPIRIPNLAGLGRGLGVPRGGYRPGLGMPAVGQQSRIQTLGIAGSQQ